MAAGLDYLFPFLFRFMTVGVMVATVDSIVWIFVTIVVTRIDPQFSTISPVFLTPFYDLLRLFSVPSTIGCMVSSSPIARSRSFAHISARSLVSAHFCVLSSFERIFCTSLYLRFFRSFIVIDALTLYDHLVTPTSSFQWT